MRVKHDRRAARSQHGLHRGEERERTRSKVGSRAVNCSSSRARKRAHSPVPKSSTTLPTLAPRPGLNQSQPCHKEPQCPAPSAQTAGVITACSGIHPKFPAVTEHSHRGCYCTDEGTLLLLNGLCTFGKLVSSSGFSMAKKSFWYHRLQLRASLCGHIVCFPSKRWTAGTISTTPAWGLHHL